MHPDALAALPALISAVCDTPYPLRFPSGERWVAPRRVESAGFTGEGLDPREYIDVVRGYDIATTAEAASAVCKLAAANGERQARLGGIMGIWEAFALALGTRATFDARCEGVVLMPLQNLLGRVLGEDKYNMFQYAQSGVAALVFADIALKLCDEIAAQGHGHGQGQEQGGHGGVRVDEGKASGRVSTRRSTGEFVMEQEVGFAAHPSLLPYLTVAFKTPLSVLVHLEEFPDELSGALNVALGDRNQESRIFEVCAWIIKSALPSEDYDDALIAVVLFLHLLLRIKQEQGNDWAGISGNDRPGVGSLTAAEMLLQVPTVLAVRTSTLEDVVPEPLITSIAMLAENASNPQVRGFATNIIAQATAEARRAPDASTRAAIVAAMEDGKVGPCGRGRRKQREGERAGDEGAGGEGVCERCDGPNCGNRANGVNPLLKCKRCKAVKYCGRECQVKHWKAGHKKMCKEAGGMEQSSRVVEGSGGAVAVSHRS